MKKIIAVLAVIIMLFGLSACGNNEIEEDEVDAALTYYEKAEEEYEKGNYDSALNLIDEAREKYGDSALFDTLEQDISDARSETEESSETASETVTETEPETVKTTAKEETKKVTEKSTEKTTSSEGKYSSYFRNFGSVQREKFPKIPDNEDLKEMQGDPSYTTSEDKYEDGRRVQYCYNDDGQLSEKVFYKKGDDDYIEGYCVYYLDSGNRQFYSAEEYIDGSSHLCETYYTEDDKPFYERKMNTEDAYLTFYDESGLKSYSAYIDYDTYDAAVTVYDKNGNATEKRYFNKSTFLKYETL